MEIIETDSSFYKLIVTHCRLCLPETKINFSLPCCICDLGIPNADPLTIIAGLIAVAEPSLITCLYAKNNDCFEFSEWDLATNTQTQLHLHTHNHIKRLLEIRAYRRRHLAKTSVGWIVVVLSPACLKIYQIDSDLTTLYRFDPDTLDLAIGWDFVLFCKKPIFHLHSPCKNELHLLRLSNGELQKLESRGYYWDRIWLETSNGPGFVMEAKGNRFFWNLAKIADERGEVPGWPDQTDVTRWHCWAIDIQGVTASRRLVFDTYGPVRDPLIHIVPVDDHYIKVNLNYTCWTSEEDVVVFTEHVYNNKLQQQKRDKLAIFVLAMQFNGMKTLKRLSLTVLLKEYKRMNLKNKHFICDQIAHIKLF